MREPARALWRLPTIVSFGPGAEPLGRRSPRRVLSSDEVRSLALAPATATVNYRLASSDRGTFLARLADAVVEPTAEVDQADLPDWGDGKPVTLYRHSSVVSIFAELSIANRCLMARHPVLESDLAAARRVEDALRVIPGVVQASATGELRVRFDPHAVAAMRLVRIAEAEILGRGRCTPCPRPNR
jgi:hypothetical protein